MDTKTNTIRWLGNSSLALWKMIWDIIINRKKFHMTTHTVSHINYTSENHKIWIISLFLPFTLYICSLSSEIWPGTASLQSVTVLILAIPGLATVLLARGADNFVDPVTSSPHGVEGEIWRTLVDWSCDTLTRISVAIYKFFAGERMREDPHVQAVRQTAG